MMVGLKKFVKCSLTFIRYPILFLFLLIKGKKNIVIGARLQINKISYLHLGSNVSIGNDARFTFITNYYGGIYSPSVLIEKNVCIGNRFSVLSAESILIKKNTLIASDVLITSENHGTNPEMNDNYAKIPLVADCVEIGCGCWIGEKVSIMPGVVLGDRCIVAANSVVTKSFPAYSMIAGIPARIIKKYNFENHTWESV